MMRAACSIALSCCAVFGAAPAVAQEVRQPLYVKFGGQVRDDGRVIVEASSRGEPVTILEERDASVRVQLKSGAGWIPKIDVGTREEVLKDASQRIADEPDNVEIRFYRLAFTAGSSSADRQQALADLEQIVRLAPKDPRGYFLRGALWAKGRQFEAAIDDFSQCLKLDAKLAPALLERGLAYYALREFDTSLEDLNAYLLLEPQAVEGFAARGMAHVEMQKYAEAEADFAAAIKLDNQLALPWFERARMWMRRHNASEAVRDLEETLKRDASHLDATLFLATLLACGPDNTPRNGKRAIELAAAACRQTGQRDFRPVEALAAAYAENGQFDLAIAEQQAALEILKRNKAPEGAQVAARMRLSQYRAGQPVRLMR